MNKIINIKEIEDNLKNCESPDDRELDEILSKALNYKSGKTGETPLNLNEALKILNCEDEEQHQKILDAAFRLKKKVFGERIVLFAPLYISSYCSNNCLYCGFRLENKAEKRIKLSPDEAVEQAKILEKRGFKRVLLVTGEDPKQASVRYIIDVIKSIYENTGIRIIHLNAPPMPINELKKIKEAGIGVFQSFQETYHPETYKKMHPSGIKANYDFRLSTMERALNAGFNDVGMGVLFGLYDYKFDVLALIQHSYYLMNKYDTYPHTVSVPRLRPASGAIITKTPYMVTDKEFERIVAVYRLALPYTGIVITTRENAVLRDKLLTCGVSQMSAGSKTDPGGYSNDEDNLDTKQFAVDDTRSLEEVIESILQNDQIPSFCTTCYRVGRVGSTFKSIAEEERIRKFCELNAILTLKEYALNHKTSSLNGILENRLNESIDKIDSEELKQNLLNKLKALEKGEKDLYY
ncbi:[FeFe] hydrogenase H-cluster radical SAM maturase HydG [bacterium]|nr:[FeFe] hydrogenase H-cluster radical SAM maturase HydG [bacterium]